MNIPNGEKGVPDKRKVSGKGADSLCLISVQEIKLDNEKENKKELKCHLIEPTTDRYVEERFSEFENEEFEEKSTIIEKLSTIEMPQLEVPKYVGVEALTNTKLISPNERIFPDEFQSKNKLTEIAQPDIVLLPLPEPELHADLVDSKINQKAEIFSHVRLQKQDEKREIELASNQPSLILNSDIFKLSDISQFKGCNCSLEKITPAIILSPKTCAIFASDIDLLSTLIGVFEEIIILSTGSPLFLSKSILYRSILSENSIFTALKPFLNFSDT